MRTCRLARFLLALAGLPALLGAGPSAWAQCSSFGVNIVNCGDFECATPTATFTTDYTYIPPGDLYPEYVYTIASNPNVYHAAFWCPCTTANAGNTTGCGCAPADRVCNPADHWMYVNGRTTPSIIWQQNITGLTVGAYYQFSALVDNLIEGGTNIFDPFLRVLVNGSPLDVDLAVPECPDVPQTWTCGFQATTSTITLSIINLSTAAAGNDFAIDDITLRQCLSTSVTLSGCNLAVVLPVEWVALSAHYHAPTQAAWLRWEAVGERNLAHYRIEKQLEGIWVGLQDVPARNTQGYVHYEWQDPAPSAYNLYRLTPIDADGSLGTSRLAELRTPLATATALRAHPNPAQQYVRATGATGDWVWLVDAQGRRVRQGPAAQPLSLQGLVPGLYVLTDGTQATRLVVE